MLNSFLKLKFENKIIVLWVKYIEKDYCIFDKELKIVILRYFKQLFYSFDKVSNFKQLKKLEFFSLVFQIVEIVGKESEERVGRFSRVNAKVCLGCLFEN